MSTVKPKQGREPSSLIQLILRADEALSTPVFQLSLPWLLEFLFSIPGNLMGPPLVQVTLPFWFFWLSSEETTDYQDLFLAIISFSFLLLLPWIFFLRGNIWIIQHIIYSNKSFALAPFLGTGVAFYFGSDRRYSQALAYHSLILYNLSCIATMFLKHGTERKRPCVTFGHLIPRKHLAIIPKILAKGAANASFPSGDVMAATAWAIPLWHMGYPTSSILLVVLAACGRMFFLAHHLLDTVVGMTVCLLVHGLLQWSPEHAALPTMGTAEWYHPIGALIALAVASRFRKGDEK
ncbi:expressed unknown protein [Seminavis robusta]|uniref:Phosphatidic acid phosphatase type 2/haloperoxidase domain-containing protein n=1 Tax=Seminavis robusta TaxID=568900 RepID=A0A9N8DM66_9STRA|nr:expressed unknown protein [Seminavis robusta]|eukprot:Sro202_g085500.1 n/a (293) ;mRNA; r:69903-70781